MKKLKTKRQTKANIRTSNARKLTLKEKARLYDEITDPSSEKWDGVLRGKDAERFIRMLERERTHPSKKRLKFLRWARSQKFDYLDSLFK